MSGAERKRPEPNARYSPRRTRSYTKEKQQSCPVLFGNKLDGAHRGVLAGRNKFQQELALGVWL